VKFYARFVASRLLAILAVFLIAAAPFTRAAENESADANIPEELGQQVGTIAVPAGISKTEVKDAIIAALSGRQWGVKSANDERVVGYLKHRSNEAKVTFVYSATNIEMYCVGWQISKRTGIREKPELPKGWLNNLRNDLTKHFNRAVTTK
jgi:hypothetical protein